MKQKSLKSEIWRKNGLIFGIALICEIAMNSINLLLSYILQVVTDIAAGVDNSITLKQVIIWCLIAFTMMGIVGYVSSKTKYGFISRAMKQYKSAVYDGITKKGISAFRNENTSFYASALTNDAQVIQDNYVTVNFDIVVQAFLFIGSIVMMLLYSPILTLAAIGMALLPFVASILTGKKLVGIEKDVSDKNEGFLALITETLSGFSVIKSFKAEGTIKGIVGKSNNELENAKRRKGAKQFIVSLWGMGAHATAQVGVFIIGAYLCLAGKGITPGMLFVFVNLMNFVIQPIAQLPAIFAKRKAAEGLIKKMDDALMADDNEAQKTEECSLSKGIKFNDLKFAYEEGKDVLKGIDYEFESGKSYAIVGASGCGKSTMLQLLLAGMDSYTGSISYDGNELRNIKPESLYDVVSTIQQNVFVFNASIRDNITMFKDFAKEEVDRVIKMSGLEKLIEEKGEDYLCGENGCGLSGGEKQRISIARALLRNSKLLLVDEATAALDAETSNMVINSILKLKDMTKIIITHDLDRNTLEQYDSILTLKGGRIVEDGNFNDLMSKKGYFYSLFNVAS